MVKNLLSWVEHVLENNTPASSVNTNWKCLGLSLWLSDSVAASWNDRLVSSSKLAHQSISTVVVKVDTADISIVERRGATSSLVVATAGSTVEGTTRGGLWTTATGSRECRTLELLLVTLALEALKQTGGGLWGELIVAKTNANWTASKIKSVHLLQCLACLSWVTESVAVSIFYLSYAHCGTYWTNP